MMRLIYTAYILLFTTSTWSQNEWTKIDRNNIYEEFISELQKYKTVSNDQKESIGLCCLKSITEKYSKSVYSNKIEVELKRIKESTIDQCTKNIGVEISSIKPNNKPSSDNVKDLFVNRETLIGSWKTDQKMTILFNEDGTFLKTYNDNEIIYCANSYTALENSTTSGDWFLSNDGELTLVENWVKLEYKLMKTNPNRYKRSAKSNYSFIDFSSDYFKFKIISGDYCCVKNNETGQLIIQANRTK